MDLANARGRRDLNPIALATRESWSYNLSTERLVARGCLSWS